jgi:hypothetical protein
MVISKKEEKMVDLVSYIREMQAKGYSLSSIKTMLMRYGYPENAIDNAIYNLSHAQSLQISKPVILGIAGALLVIIIGISFMFVGNVSSKRLLSLAISDFSKEVVLGNLFTASVDVVNNAKPPLEEVFMRYRIFNSEKKPIAYQSDKIAVEKTKSLNVNMQIPGSSSEGDYTFFVNADYKASSASASSDFKVLSAQAVSQKKPTCSDGIKNQAEEDIDCGGQCKPCRKCPLICQSDEPGKIGRCDASTNFECKYETVAQCGDDICSASEDVSCPDDCRNASLIPPAEVVDIFSQLDSIKQLAASNEEEALKKCAGIQENFKDDCLKNVGEASLDANVCYKVVDDSLKDKCFSSIAKGLKSPALCENVREDKRDQCYVSFAVDGDYSVCEKILNRYLKRSCEALKESQLKESPQ